MQAINQKQVSFKEVNAALAPLLDKLLANIPQSAKAKIDTNETDGIHLIFEAHDYFYKILGSEYHAHTQECFLNVVRATDSWKNCYDSVKLEQESVDGSTDLRCGFLEHYDWTILLVTDIISGEYGS